MTFIEYYGKRKEVSAGRADSVRTIHIAGWIISLGDQLDADVWLRNFTFAKFGFQEHYFWHKEGNSATAIKEIFQLEWRYPRVNKDFFACCQNEDSNTRFFVRWSSCQHQFSARSSSNHFQAALAWWKWWRCSGCNRHGGTATNALMYANKPASVGGKSSR